MFGFILQKIIGTENERTIKKLQPLVDTINGLEPEIKKLSDAELRAKTDEFRARIGKESLVDSSESTEDEVKTAEQNILDGILPEAFAVVREVALRTLKMRHHDVQLIGGMVLHKGKIAEMANGEGKTLVATLPAYLNALTGKGVHIVTVNDYLANRDREWMGPIYEFLGLTVGVIQHDMAPKERQIAYGCDITYGTNNEFGFDYLRDNMVIRKEDMVQRNLHYAIVDELDSILIDEARTPLIISGPTEESVDKYYEIDKIIPKLKEGKRDETTKEESGDFIVDEKARTTYLTEEGEIKAAKLLGLKSLHDIDSMEHKHHVNQALRAHKNFKLDVDYVVKNGEVIIVDEFTGRLMPGRRWSDGLHQAVEAKEKVRIERENQTLATITFQNYFRMYEKLAGMTGTALTEAKEFREIYKLDVVTIPTNEPVKRIDSTDVIYKTQKEKFNAVCDEVIRLNKEKKPVLVGTISIDKSERLSEFLKRRGIPHKVLNAKFHDLEAHIVAQAGRLGAITIATNMAGRGTDIRLGGNIEFMAEDLLRQQKIGPYDLNYKEEREKLLPSLKKQLESEHAEVLRLGGLHVIGTERHESRRIDNQLRGRAGRQGDPGSSRFYLSLEDDLMRIFGSDRIAKFMDFFKWEEGMPIEHNIITKAVETAQKRVEAHNFEIRKQLLEYDNVMNRQREIIYKERRNVLESDSLKDYIFEMIDDNLEAMSETYMSSKEAISDETGLKSFAERIKSCFLINVDDLVSGNYSTDEIMESISERLKKAYEDKEKALGVDIIREIEKTVLLQTMDSKWKDHLYAMDNLREGIGLRAYGQRDPLIEYQHEGYQMFSDMIGNIKEEAVEFMFKIQAISRRERLSSVFSNLHQDFVHPETVGLGLRGVPESSKRDEVSEVQPQPVTQRTTPYQTKGQKVGRNEPCPCGSGKKYKKCCGR